MLSKNSGAALQTEGPFDVDLHTHTTASDGTCTSVEVIELAAQKGIRVLAITDHDSTLGVAEAMAAGQQLGVEVVPATELSIRDEPDKDFLELHLLGYFIDLGNPALNEILNQPMERRLDQKRSMIRNLQKLGFNVPEEEVFTLARGVPHKPHIFEVVQRHNPDRVAGRQQFFDEYLNYGGKAYVPRPFEPFFEEAIQIVLAAGGVPVLSHPAAYSKVQDPIGMVRHAVSLGLHGIEVNYPYDKTRFHQSIPKVELRALIHRFDALADELCTLKTGGSDFHGSCKSIELGEMGMIYEDYLHFKQACDR